MTLPILLAAEPSSVPAKVYDKLWIEEVVIAAPDPNGDALARVRVRKFCITDGTAELEPTPGIWLEVTNVLAGASADPDLAAVVDSLMAYVGKIGAEHGVVRPRTE